MKNELLEKMINTRKNWIVSGDAMSGKTMNVIFPYVDTIIQNNENLFILDSKEEYLHQFYDKLKENGYDIITINLRDMSASEGWNPLSYAYQLYQQNDKDTALELLDIIGKTMNYDTEQGADPFWEETATSFFKGVVLGLFEDAEESEIHFNSVNTLYNQLGKKEFGRGYLADYFHGKNPKSSAYIYAAPTIMAPVSTKESILSVARQQLTPYIGRKNLSTLLSKTTFPITKLSENKTAIFFINKDENKELNRLAAMFIEQLFYILIAQEQKNPYYFIVDNLDTIDHIHQLTNMLGSGLSKNIKFILGTRSISELKETYGKYIHTLCDSIELCDKKLKVMRNQEKEELEITFEPVTIAKSNITYPTLKETEIPVFDLESYMKKGQEKNTPMASEQNKSNISDLIRKLDEKISELSNEKKEYPLLCDIEKSELEQFKVEKKGEL